MNKHESIDNKSKFDAFPVKLGEFEGPLDLLLHLVRANELDITDLPIASVTDQYNEYLSMMKEMNLEIAGEYLVMASNLIYIKSRMLLPPDPDAEQEDEEDPREELVQQLLEYQRFKQAAENLGAIDSVRSLIWTRDGKVPEEFADEELLAVDLYDLLKAFRGLVGRLSAEAKLQFKREKVSVADKIQWLEGRLQEEETLSIASIVESLESRQEVIAVFLAMLEMMRLQMIVAFQRTTLGEIRIALRKESESETEAPNQPVGSIITSDGSTEVVQVSPQEKA